MSPAPAAAACTHTTARVALLAAHRDSPLVGGGDEVVVVVWADVELDPGDGAGESARLGCVVVADGGCCIGAEVAGLVGGEDHRDGGGEPASSLLVAVEVQRNVAAATEPSSVVGELH